MKVELRQKYSFQNYSNECENRKLLVPGFRSYTKAQSQMFQSYYVREDKASNLLNYLPNISENKYPVAHSDDTSYTSCMSI